jgi:transposase
MAGRRSPVTDVREILRRLQLREPERRIARDLGVGRNTVARYREWAEGQQLLEHSALPEPGALAALLQPAPDERSVHEQSLVEPFREQVIALQKDGVEGQAIYQLLVEQHQFGGSYSSVKRFLRQLAPSIGRATLRIEVEPGDEAQVDFGTAGQFLDRDLGRIRRAWVFVMVLSHSRHQYAELVFDQTVATWLRLHRAAFEFFGGVPCRVVLDNLRAAIVHAALYDPEVQRSYREFAEHYGFLIAPCRPRTPEHKGKVEQGGVHYVKRNALAGRAFRDIHDGNRHLWRWCLETAGRRVHGTTKRIPLEVFDHIERPALRPLPVTPWELTEWKQAKLHADCHVVFEGAYYSAPHRLLGERLWVRATVAKIRIRGGLLKAGALSDSGRVRRSLARAGLGRGRRTRGRADRGCRSRRVGGLGVTALSVGLTRAVAVHVSARSSTRRKTFPASKYSTARARARRLCRS